MRREPLVTVVINNYNYGRFLREAIDSALAQTYRAVEVIVVDDGSTDDSREVIESYGRAVRPVFKTNGGQGSAFNVGFEAAAGDIVCLLDADDTWRPTKVERVVTTWLEGASHADAPVALLRHNLVAIGTSVGSPYPQGSHVPGIARVATHPRIPSQLALVRRYNAPSSAMAVNGRIARELVQVPQGRFRISADAFLYTVLPTLGLTVDVPDVLGEYRLHGTNNYASSSALQARLRTELELVASLRDRNLAPVLPVQVVRHWDHLRALDTSLPRMPLTEGLYHLWRDEGTSFPRRIARVARHMVRTATGSSRDEQ